MKVNENCCGGRNTTGIANLNGFSEYKFFCIWVEFVVLSNEQYLS